MSLTSEALAMTREYAFRHGPFPSLAEHTAFASRCKRELRSSGGAAFAVDFGAKGRAADPELAGKIGKLLFDYVRNTQRGLLPGTDSEIATEISRRLDKTITKATDRWASVLEEVRRLLVADFRWTRSGSLGGCVPPTKWNHQEPGLEGVAFSISSPPLSQGRHRKVLAGFARHCGVSAARIAERIGDPNLTDETAASAIPAPAALSLTAPAAPAMSQARRRTVLAEFRRTTGLAATPSQSIAFALTSTADDDSADVALDEKDVAAIKKTIRELADSPTPPKTDDDWALAVAGKLEVEVKVGDREWLPWMRKVSAIHKALDAEVTTETSSGNPLIDAAGLSLTTTSAPLMSASRLAQVRKEFRRNTGA